jgi:ubiquinone/menaquinone biosynthesis C-methylase UbiE
MSDNNVSFTGSIPEHYERFLGPIIFADYAVDMADMVAAAAPGRVLETAGGTGIVTRALRDRLPPAASLVATDFNPPMLAVARAKFRAGERVEFRQADATQLPFPDASFDAVVSQFGLMFFPDKPASYREARRVLGRGGRYFFSVWDSHEYNAFGRLAHESIARFFTSEPPPFYVVPFGSHAIDPIKADVLRAGFKRLDIQVIRRDKPIPSVRDFGRGLIYGNPTIDQIRQRGVVDPERVVDALAGAFEREFGALNAAMTMQAILFEARE